jgi:hypothetical protein
LDFTARWLSDQRNNIQVTKRNADFTGCELLFASVLVIKDPTSTRGKAQLEELQLHHKSIDMTYTNVDVCKVVVTDQFTAI